MSVELVESTNETTVYEGGKLLAVVYQNKDDTSGLKLATKAFGEVSIPDTMKLPLANKKLREIGAKWIKYAQSSCDVNDIAAAIWSALHEAELYKASLNAMTRDEFISMQNELDNLNEAFAKGEDSPEGERRGNYLSDLLDNAPWTIDMDGTGGLEGRVIAA